LHDAVTVEKAGIAATAIITDGFVQTALAISRVSGMPEFPFAVIPHARPWACYADSDTAGLLSCTINERRPDATQRQALHPDSL